MTLEEARHELMFCDSYSRLPVLLELECEFPRADWLKLLGEEWAVCDNIGVFTEEIIDLLCGEKQIREMMTDRELMVLQGLPDVFRIYRGCYENNKCGLSWSLKKEVAEKFTQLHRYRQEGIPLLITAEARREEVIALKLGRKEREIIIFQPKIISVEKKAPDCAGAKDYIA